MWRAIKGDGTRELVRCSNRLDSKEYQSVLSQGLFQVYDSLNIFMQDIATCHKSRCKMQFLEEEKLCIIDDWSPQSPDLNVIENLVLVK